MLHEGNNSSSKARSGAGRGHKEVPLAPQVYLMPTAASSGARAGTAVSSASSQ